MACSNAVVMHSRALDHADRGLSHPILAIPPEALLGFGRIAYAHIPRKSTAKLFHDTERLAICQPDSNSNAFCGAEADVPSGLSSFCIVETSVRMARPTSHHGEKRLLTPKLNVA